MRDPLTRLFDILERHGVAKRAELVAWGIDAGFLTVLIESGRHLVRVRRGWYARPGEHPDVLRAWRAGGRLACVSALSFHLGVEGPSSLHLEVPGNTARLHDPANPSRPIAAGEAAEVGIIVHWVRHPRDVDRRAVALDVARLQAGRCYAAASSASASRIV